MLTFSYTVKDENGKTIKGMADAVDKETLVEQLQRQGYYIVNVALPTKESLEATPVQKSKPTKKFSHNKVDMSDKLLFSRQLATMLEAGVNLLRSLNVIVGQIESKQFHKILTQVRDDIEQGLSLSVALAKYPKVFSTLWVSLVEVGEASGTMPMVLDKLAFYIEREEKFRSAVISGLIYPALLFIVAIGAILVFAFVIGPKFEDLYGQFDAELPALTVAVLGFFKLLTKHFFQLLGVICVIFVLARKYFRTPIGQVQLEGFIFMLPVAGPVIKTIVVEKFTSQMSILIDTGVPILYALDIVERMIGNKTCEAVIKQMKEKVREGRLVSEEMSKSNFFPPMATQMIAIGEETGELGKMLNHVAEFYQRFVETFIHRFATIFEPFMLIFMGATIGVLVLAMFLPIFDISSMAGGGGG
ncbi:MAG: type II secretion system F family protein [Candidatus Aceula meridiana]|nr:type II secretion system F family protein [Candidatus Aceula meridiana]